MRFIRLRAQLSSVHTLTPLRWLASRDTGIDETRNSTYTNEASGNGKVIKVRVIFNDDACNPESLTSQPTVAVTIGG